MSERDRMSIPYFSSSARGASIEPIAEIAGSTTRYRELVWSDYMRARTDDNYADLGVDDAQITDYLIDA